MAVSALIDTGAILALLDRDDEWHRACVEAFNATFLPLLTTEAVLTEVFHLTKRDARDIQGVWTLLRSGSVKLAAITDEELPEIHSLMTKYKDRPMDFADATLVYLAARESLSLILTVDHDDFETYRIGGRKRFSILPNAVSQMYQGQPKRFTPCQPAHLVNSRKSQRGIRPTAKLRG